MVNGNPTSITLASQQLTAGSGGIGRVGRLSVAALEQIAQLAAFAAMDKTDHIVSKTKIKGFSNQRASFVLAVNYRLMFSNFAIYDFPGTARAHFQPYRPYALWVHGNEFWNEEETPKRYLGPMLRAKVLLANSHLTAKAIENALGPRENVHVCWLATEEENAPTQSWSEEGSPTLLFVGRNDPGLRKGQARLIKVWPEIVKRVPNAKLRFIGGGIALQYLRKIASQSEVAKSIDVLGFVPENEMICHWRDASALALLGNLEGFGLVVVEAMRFSKPVIGSLQDASSEINIHGRTGFNIDPDDHRSLVESVSTLMSNQDLARGLGAAGKKRWKSNFRPSQFNDRLIAAISSIM